MTWPGSSQGSEHVFGCDQTAHLLSQFLDSTLHTALLLAQPLALFHDLHGTCHWTAALAT